MEITPGALLTDHLRLVRPLGSGGMGSVWLADHLGLHAPVAVKLLSARHVWDERARARFAVEAAAAARIRSAHVVEVLDCGVADGTPFIVMEWLRGQDLQARLAREGRLSVEALVPIVRGVCHGLELAHAMGVVHRDIKPANLFLVDGPDGPQVKVLDFGLAKLDGGPVHESTASGSVFGTLAYLSPEQAESSRDATWRSDLWSLGVVVYQCLTGAAPFAQESLMGMCLAIGEARFKPASELRPELPGAIDAWLARALQREPEDRFPSAREMGEAFAHAALGGTASRSLVPRSVSTHAPSGPRKTARLAAAAFALALPATLGVWQLASRSSSAPPSQAVVAAALAPVTTLAGESASAAVVAVVAPVVPGGPVVDPSAQALVTLARDASTPGHRVASGAPVAVASAAPEPSSSASNGNGPARVQVTMVITNDLYPPPYLLAQVAKVNDAVNACFRPPGSERWLSTFEVYTLDVASTGVVTDVGRPAQAAPAIDACMTRTLRGLPLRPTDLGVGGRMTVGFALR